MQRQQTLYPNLIIDALRQVRYPGNGQNIVDLDMVEDDIRIDGRKVSFSLIFERPTDPFIKSVVKAAEAAILTFVADDVEIKGNITVKTRRHNPEKPANHGRAENVGVKQSDLVAFPRKGNGEVGGHSAFAHAAFAGTDTYYVFYSGQRIGRFFRIVAACFYRYIAFDLHIVLSIGFLVDADKPVLWRGSMASNALNQLITQADWGELDYFLIDMPPGTSDIHLTLVQTLGITGVVVVSTPQQVALADARKGIAMFMGDKVNVPVLGLVENMAWFTPAAHPQERYYIFGREGAKMLASELNVPLLGQIPLVADICEQADLGSPIALADSVEGEAFMQLADNVVAAVDSRNESLPPTEKVNVTKK